MDKAIKIIKVFLFIVICSVTVIIGLLTANVFSGKAELASIAAIIIGLMIIVHLCVKWETHRCLNRFTSSPYHRQY